MSKTFLQLARMLRREGRGSGSGPSTVVSQTGDMESIVEWTKQSYIAIQNSKRNWRWLWGTVVIPISAGQRDYTIAQIEALVPSMTRWKHWKPNGFKYYVNSEGVAGERPLVHRLYERAYEGDYGTVPTAVRPNSVSIMPDGALHLAQQPTAAGTLTATYYKEAQELALDADVPEMPGDFHDLIVWNALVDFGIVEAASEMYERALIHINRMYPQLMADQLEPVELFATTLAE